METESAGGIVAGFASSIGASENALRLILSLLFGEYFEPEITLIVQLLCSEIMSI